MKKNIILILTLGLVLGLNIYFRCYPIYFPQLKTQAKNIAEKKIEQFAIRDVQQRFPQFYPTAKDRIVKARISEYKKQNKGAIKAQIQNLYLQLKDKFQDDSGQTYLMELDCWHWSRYVENVIRRGRPGDETIYDSEWDLFMLAPTGAYLFWEDFLYYFAAYLYKFFSIFKSIPLFSFLFYLPLFFAAVFIIVLYMFSFRYSGHIGAIISCLFVGLAPIFLHRSCAGWFDRDILNLLFPLLVIWTYISSCANQPLRRRLFWVCFSSFWVGLFSYTWTQWWFIFLFIIIYEFLYLLGLICAHLYFRKDNFSLLKTHALSLFSFLFFSLSFVLLISGPQPLVTLYHFATTAVAISKPLMASIWPNVYYTVGELRRTDIHDIARATGGVFIFTSSLLSMLILMIYALRGRTYTDSKRSAIMILAVWFISMIFASIRGVRFIVFLLIPLGLSLGWLINQLYEYFKNRKNLLGRGLVVTACIVFSAIYIKGAHRAASNIYPLINDAWYNVLSLIKEKTPQQTIVNSWWDYGDWFKVIARRRVIFDGQSQDTPQAHWMARALLTNSEEQSMAILRMLNNGGNKAFEIINEHVRDPLEAVLLLENVMLLHPEKAQQILVSYLPPAATEEVMKILFYNPSRACLVIEYSMLPKIGAISYLGNWDFSKVYIAQKFDSEEKDIIIEHLKKLGRGDEPLQKFYQEAFLITTKNLDDWLSKRLQFSSALASGHEKEGTVFFDNGFAYNIEKRIIRSNTGVVPRSLFVLIGDDFTEMVYPNANSPFSALVIKEETEEDEEGKKQVRYKCILLDRELATSMLARLYFFNGKGLKHFASFIDSEEGNNYIRVFNIIW